jgi:hypothetical protein
MLRHIVMMKFNEKGKAENGVAKIKEMLNGLVKTVEPLKKMEVGVSDFDNNVFGLVLTADFEDEAGLNAYRTHPDHVKILDYMKEVVEQVAAVDYLV